MNRKQQCKQQHGSQVSSPDTAGLSSAGNCLPLSRLPRGFLGSHSQRGQAAHCALCCGLARWLIFRHDLAHHPVQPFLLSSRAARSSGPQAAAAHDRNAERGRPAGDGRGRQGSRGPEQLEEL
jgi:hypothetical protein